MRVERRVRRALTSRKLSKRYGGATDTPRRRYLAWLWAKLTPAERAEKASRTRQAMPLLLIAERPAAMGAR